MSHLSVRTLIKDAAQSLQDNLQFGYGRRSDFNLIKDPSSPYVWLLPLTSNPRFAVNNTEIYQKTWNCIVLFLYEDRSDSVETEFDDILDKMDDLVDKFVIRLNDYYLKSSDTVGAMTLQNFSQNPFIKSDADIFTGWFLTFQMVVSDDFQYCTDDNIALYSQIPPQ